MAKHCLHCKKDIVEDSVIDICKKCGYNVWGEKMFNTIEDNMRKAKDVGDLYQGSVTDFTISKKITSRRY